MANLEPGGTEQSSLDVLRRLDGLLASIARGQEATDALDDLGRALVEGMGFAAATGHLALDEEAARMWEGRLAEPSAEPGQLLVPMRTGDGSLLGVVVLTDRPGHTEAGPADPHRAELVEIVVRQVGYALDTAHRASRDPLTGLLNWSGVYRRLERLMATLRDPARPGAVMFCDLNGYKQINDRYGHLVGDDILAEVAGRIAGIVRQTDAVGRYGGDEFVLVLPDIGRAQADETAARVLRAIHEPIPVDGGVCEVGASLGVVLVDRGAPARDVLDRADQAMYAAKRDRTGSGHVTYSMNGTHPEPAPS